MWVIRPDAVYALDLPGVQRVFGRYVRVVRDELPAKYLIAKRVEVKFNPRAREEKLWQIHKRALRRYHNLERKIDEGKMNWNKLPRPKRSLLDLKCAIAGRIMAHCHFCARRCEVNRAKGELGFCQAGTEWRVFGAHMHMGEECFITPSGTIFLAACTMRCVYCCNAPESVTPKLGSVWTTEDVVRWIERIRRDGARNINWVGGTPTCWLAHILRALKLSETNVPQVWNDNAYYSPETAALLDGMIDVYLLDFRYFSEKCARRLSSAPNYPQVAARNHLSAAKAGELLVRLLVMPGHLECDAKPIVRWIRANLGEWVRLNILAQFFPYHRAKEYAELSRSLSAAEHREVVEFAKGIGLKNLERD
jgi:putative pyruvate formate lyase activating enzyme